MAAPHSDVLPECAERLGELTARLDNLEEDGRDHRQDYRELRTLMLDGFIAVRADVATLKERARGWGIIGGLIGSLGVGIAGALILAAVL